MRNELNLAPGLLLSMPQLADPNFTRAVVLMIEHGEEGSFGLVVNQPSDMPVASLLDVLEVSWRGDPSAVVWSGGPVMPATGWVLHQPLLADEQTPDLHHGMETGCTVSVCRGVSLSTSTAKLRTIAASPPHRTRFLLGYAGWGPGQLAEEIARGSWLHADATPEIIFDTPAGDMWSHALRSLGVYPESLVQTRGIH